MKFIVIRWHDTEVLGRFDTLEDTNKFLDSLDRDESGKVFVYVDIPPELWPKPRKSMIIDNLEA